MESVYFVMGIVRITYISIVMTPALSVYWFYNYVIYST